jgi:hypothetical protein
MASSLVRVRVVISRQGLQVETPGIQTGDCAPFEAERSQSEVTARSLRVADPERLVGIAWSEELWT